MKKIIVTGGAGFIGSHTAVELARSGYLPVVVDNFSNSERTVIDRMRKLIDFDFPVHELDCTDEQALNSLFEIEGNVSGLIHFAAYKAVNASIENPLSYYANNVGSLVAVLKSIQKAGVNSFVFSSSCTVYGQPDVLPVTENSPIKKAETPYGRSKQFCESIIDDHIASGASIRSATLRYFNPVGAHPSSLIGELPIGSPENLVPYITQTAVGLRPRLTVFGNDYPTIDGTCIRDYIHVVDLAKAHVLALDWLGENDRSKFNEVFNIGTGHGTSILEIIAAFEYATNVSVNYEIGARRPGDIVTSYADVSKAKQILNFETKLTVVDAMRDAYRWQMSL